MRHQLLELFRMWFEYCFCRTLFILINLYLLVAMYGMIGEQSECKVFTLPDFLVCVISISCWLFMAFIAGRESNGEVI